jgi:hypothetical protein
VPPPDSPVMPMRARIDLRQRLQEVEDADAVPELRRT